MWIFSRRRKNTQVEVSPILPEQIARLSSEHAPLMHAFQQIFARLKVACDVKSTLPLSHQVRTQQRSLNLCYKIIIPHQCEYHPRRLMSKPRLTSSAVAKNKEWRATNVKNITHVTRGGGYKPVLLCDIHLSMTTLERLRRSLVFVP